MSAAPGGPPGVAARRAVVFDLDGTLIDSARDIATCLNFALNDFGLGQLAIGDVRGMIGSGAKVLVERALGALGVTDDAGLVGDLIERFEVHYLQLGVGESVIYEGGMALLRGLRTQGVGLGICTNKPDAIAKEVVRGLGMGDFFGAVRGVDGQLARKPAPDMLFAVLADLGCQPGDALVVGDSITDVEMARAAGVAVIVVSYGYTNIPADQLGADGVIEDLGSVADWVVNGNAGS